MSTRSWRLPDATLRTELTRVVAVGLLATALAATLVAGWLGAGLPYVLTSTALFAMTMAWAVGAAGARHPHQRFGPANRVTTVRVLLVALAAGLLTGPANATAAWLVVGLTTLLSVLDGLDGRLARRSGLASDFGARFDMEADALFVLVLSVLVWSFGKAGAWVLACGLMRYVFVGAGLLLPWMSRPLTPTVRGKTVAVLQFAGLALAIAPPIPRPVSDAVAAVALVVLTGSFGLDVGRLWRRR